MTLSMAQALAGVFLGVWLVSWGLSRLGRWFSLGHDRAEGIQKVHTQPTSRLGGVGIAMGLVMGTTYVWTVQTHGGGQVDLLLWLCLTALPVWLGGLAEDLTHKVGPSLRLLLAMVSAAWLYSAGGVAVQHTDVWLVDQMLRIPGASLCLTLLVVAGFTHSVNITDGFHGLASGLCLVMFGALAALAWSAGDTLVLKLGLVGMAATAGFFVVNWPSGKIFLGDAGAYILGFWVVETGLLLVMRNPGISPMAPVVVGIVPLIETLFSMYRRRVVRKHPVNHPDALHLHTLVYRRVVRKNTPPGSKQGSANARVAVYFWAAAALWALGAWWLRDNTAALLGLMVLYLAAYIWCYRRLVHLHAPRTRLRN